MKHDTLQLLFVEALVHQACSNMLNMMFHDGLRLGVPLDSERAVLVGRFFASVNIAACVLQIVVMPSVLSQSTLPQVLSAIPLIVLAIVVCGFVYPCLLSVMVAFGALKVLGTSVCPRKPPRRIPTDTKPLSHSVVPCPPISRVLHQHRGDGNDLHAHEP
jgi:hypothetical protein